MTIEINSINLEIAEDRLDFFGRKSVGFLFTKMPDFEIGSVNGK